MDALFFGYFFVFDRQFGARMIYKKSLRGIAQYAQGSSRAADIETASPHRLIQILMQTLLGRLAATKGALERDDSLEATQNASRAQAIITELRSSLDYEQGKEIAITLNSLYDYMGRRLMQAIAAKDVAMVNEVTSLMTPIKEGWDEIKKDAEEAKPE